MPTNVYRIQGPEGSVPYQQFLIPKNNDRLDEIANALMKGKRCDNRDISTHRSLCKILQMCITFNVNSNYILVQASRLVLLLKRRDLPTSSSVIRNQCVLCLIQKKFRIKSNTPKRENFNASLNLPHFHVDNGVTTLGMPKNDS